MLLEIKRFAGVLKLIQLTGVIKSTTPYGNAYQNVPLTVGNYPSFPKGQATEPKGPNARRQSTIW